MRTIAEIIPVTDLGRSRLAEAEYDHYHPVVDRVAVLGEKFCPHCGRSIYALPRAFIGRNGEPVCAAPETHETARIT